MEAGRIECPRTQIQTHDILTAKMGAAHSSVTFDRAYRT
jgi:hypothetical protein